jgi:G patch domain-containing protein 1
MDIFKAIFASDAEDSEDDEEPNAPMTSSPIPAGSTLNKALGAASEALAPDIESPQPIDLASFKPKFVSRSHRDQEGGSTHPDNAARRSKSDKHRKSESKVKRSLVSFDADDEGAESLNVVVSSTVKKSRKKEKVKEKKRVRDEGEDKELKRARLAMTESGVHEGGEWVERTPPPLSRSSPGPAHGGPLRPKDAQRPVRPKASDFL